ncbi:Phosphatidylinositol transfer protein 2 [Orchesella cincta]|uniref:Phosphatidylinositol transfer protein 2 n=1 Tax=Orchesella cincta TaxID=48709 RepID=A0A1D2NB81_ORCCI|nr:Phosphatidylinositol transfer protein 2 [Orchesella cincta]
MSMRWLAVILKERKTCDYPEEVLLKEPVGTIPYFGETVEREVGEHSIKRYGWTPESSYSIIADAFSNVMSVCEAFVGSSMKITEIETWESFPYYRSVSKNQAAKDAYTMIIEAKYLPGNGSLHNALKLPEDLLQQREIVLVDIAASVPWADYRDGKDPALFRCKENGRGGLKAGEWMNTAHPVMTSYILVSIKYDLPGVSRMVEKRLQNGIHRAMVLHHRELFCLMDRWIGFTLNEVKELEKEAQDELAALMCPSSSTEQDPVAEEEETKSASQPCSCPISQAKEKICSLGSGGSVYFMPIAVLVLCVFIAVASNHFDLFGFGSYNPFQYDKE